MNKEWFHQFCISFDNDDVLWGVKRRIWKKQWIKESWSYQIKFRKKNVFYKT